MINSFLIYSNPLALLCSYCECFAAGVYCGDSCTCQGCFNRPEYEKTVMEAREQIESRNPLAFAPKIVLTTEVSPIVNKVSNLGFFEL